METKVLVQKQDFGVSATLAKILEVGQSLLVIRDLDILLRKIVENAGIILCADIVVLYQFWEESQDVEIPPIVWGNIQYLDILEGKGHVVPYKESTVFKVLNKRRKKPIYAADAKKYWGHLIEEEKWKKGKLRTFLYREDITSSAAVRLTAENQRVGVLFVNYRTRHSFPEKEKQIIEYFAAQAAIVIENVRLRADLEHQLQQKRQQVEAMELLREVSERINSKLVLDETLTLIVKSAMQLTKTNSGVIHLIDQNGQSIIRSVEYPETFDHPTPRLSKKVSMTRTIIDSGKTIAVADVRKEPRVNQVMYDKGIKSLIGLPIKLEGKVTGVLYLNSVLSREFTDDEQSLLLAFADQAAIAIQNAGLYEQRIKDIEALKEINQTITAGITSLDNVLQKIVDKLVDIFHVVTCAIRLYDPITDKYGNRIASGELSEEVKNPPRSSGTSRHIIETKKPVYATDPSFTLPDGQPVIREEIRIKGIKAVAFLPLLSEGDVIGILYMEWNTFRSFSENEKKVLELFAGQAATAIKTFQLFHELDERAAQLLRLQKVTTNILVTRSDLETLLRSITKNLSDMFGALCAIRLYKSDTNRFTDQIEADEQIEGFNYQPRLHGTSRYVINERHAFYADNNSAALPNGQPAIRDELKKLGIKAIARLPLLCEGEVIGVLYVNLIAPHTFSSNDKLILELFASEAAVSIENARLYAQRRNDIAALQEINAVITSKKLSEITDLIVQKATELTEAEVGALWLVEERKGVRQLILEAGYGKRPKSNILPIDDTSISGRVALNGKSYICPDVIKDPYYIEYYEGIKSNITVPLHFGGKVVGCLNTESIRENAFTDYHLGMLQSVADQAAIAIETARLFNNAQKRIRDLEILNRVAQIIGTKLAAKDLLQTIVNEISDQLNCSHCTLFLLQKENEKEMLVPQVTKGTRKQVMTRRFKIDEGLAGWVYQHGESIVLANANDDSRFAPAREKRSGFRSALVAPVKVGNRTIGVISAEQDVYGWFSEDDRRLVDALALGAGFAIERAIGLELLEKISNQIRSLQNIQNIGDMLKQILNCAISLTQTTTGVIYLISEDGNSVIHSYFPTGFEHPKPRLKKQEGLTRTVFETGCIIAIPDIHQDTRVNPMLRVFFQSMIAVPLKIEERVIGVLYLNDEKIHHFTEIEMSLLTTLASQAAIAIENARLFNQRQVLVEFGKDIVANICVREDQILKLIYDRTSKLMDTSDISIALYDEIKDKVRFGLAMQNGRIVDVNNESGWGIRPGLKGKGKTNEVIRTKMPLILDTPRKVENWYAQDGHERYIKGPRDSWIGVPMLLGDRVLGVINCSYVERDYVYGEEGVKILQAIANYAAVALDNAQMFSSANQKRDALVKFLRAIASGIRLDSDTILSEDKVLNSIYEQASALMNTTDISIGLYDEENNLLRFGLAIREGNPVDVDKIPGWKPRPGTTGMGKTNAVIRTKEPLVLTSQKDVNDWYSDPSHKKYIDEPLASWLGVPMMIGNKILGVIGIYHREEEHKYSSDDIEIMQALANQAALAMFNAKNFQELEYAHKKLRNSLDMEVFIGFNHIHNIFEHKINNTVGFIRTKTKDLLESDLLDWKIRTALSSILDAANEALESPNEATVEANKLLSSEQEKIDMSKIRRDLLREDILSKNANIKVIFNNFKHLPKIKANYRILYEGVFVELVRNAIKAMRDGGQIIFNGAKVENSYIKITVSDEGCGIPIDIREHIFEYGKSFWELQGDEKKGGGKGLFYTKSIINFLGGEITVRENRPKGTLFEIKLPF